MYKINIKRLPQRTNIKLLKIDTGHRIVVTDSNKYLEKS